MPGPSAASLSTSEAEDPRLREASSAARLPSGLLGRLKALSPLDIAITLAFALILVVQISRHYSWRGEADGQGLAERGPPRPRGDHQHVRLHVVRGIRRRIRNRAAVPPRKAVARQPQGDRIAGCDCAGVRNVRGGDDVAESRHKLADD